MTLCSDGHDEVCYEVRTCPACAVAAAKDAEIYDLKRQLDLQNEAEEAKEKEE